MSGGARVQKRAPTAEADMHGAAGAADADRDDFSSGPLQMLQQAAQSGTPVLILCRNSHKLLATVRAFDRHCNMVLENVKDIWTETQRAGRAKGKQVTRDRFVSKMFLRGDSVIIVLRNIA